MRFEPQVWVEPIAATQNPPVPYSPANPPLVTLISLDTGEVIPRPAADDQVSSTIDISLKSAINFGDLNLFRVLLQAQGYPKYKGSDYVLLNKAMRQHQYAIAEYLVDRQDCRVSRKRGYCANTPLHYALQAQNRELARKLVARGANVEDRNTRLETPLHAAFYHFDAEMIELLFGVHLERSRANLVDAKGLSYLHIACCSGTYSFAYQLLLQEHVDVDSQIQKDSKIYPGYTPLHMAVEFNRYDAAELLLSHGASIYVQDARGSTPLHLALLRKNRDMIDLILSCDNARGNPANESGLTHFHAACAHGDEKVVTAFLRSNSHALHYVNQTTYPLADAYPGYTSLHFAAEFGHSGVCSLLLAYSANCGATTFDGHKPGDLARMNHHHETARYIEGYCASFERYYNEYMSRTFDAQRQTLEAQHQRTVMSCCNDANLGDSSMMDFDDAETCSVTDSTFDDMTPMDCQFSGSYGARQGYGFGAPSMDLVA